MRCCEYIKPVIYEHIFFNYLSRLSVNKWNVLFGSREKFWFFFTDSNEVLGFPGYPRLTPLIILVVRPKRRRISCFIFKTYLSECHLQTVVKSGFQVIGCYFSAFSRSYYEKDTLS